MQIPKVFHRVWLGGAPMPKEYVEFGDSWIRYHPDWKMIHWCEKNRPFLANENSFWNSRSFSQQSDVLRYELIYRFGGIYLDVDFECCKSIEPLISRSEFFIAEEVHGTASVGVFGAVPNHIILYDAVQQIPRRMSIPNVAESFSTGPGLMTAVLSPYRNLQGVSIFGPEYFYPYLWNEKHRRNEKFPAAYAVHHWSGSWCVKPNPPIASARNRVRPPVRR